MRPRAGVSEAYRRGEVLTERQRCLVVDAHPMVRLGIRRLLADSYDIDEASSRAEALELVRDIGAFDRQAPGLPIIAYGAEPERHLATRATQAGACCFVSRKADGEQLAKAVRAAAEGDRHIDPAVP